MGRSFAGIAATERVAVVVVVVGIVAVGRSRASSCWQESMTTWTKRSSTATICADWPHSTASFGLVAVAVDAAVEVAVVAAYLAVVADVVVGGENAAAVDVEYCSTRWDLQSGHFHSCSMQARSLLS